MSVSYLKNGKLYRNSNIINNSIPYLTQLSVNGVWTHYLDIDGNILNDEFKKLNKFSDIKFIHISHKSLSAIDNRNILRIQSTYKYHLHGIDKYDYCVIKSTCSLVLTIQGIVYERDYYDKYHQIHSIPKIIDISTSDNVYSWSILLDAENYVWFRSYAPKFRKLDLPRIKHVSQNSRYLFLYDFDNNIWAKLYYQDEFVIIMNIPNITYIWHNDENGPILFLLDNTKQLIRCDIKTKKWMVIDENVDSLPDQPMPEVEKKY